MEAHRVSRHDFRDHPANKSILGNISPKFLKIAVRYSLLRAVTNKNSSGTFQNHLEDEYSSRRVLETTPTIPWETPRAKQRCGNLSGDL